MSDKFRSFGRREFLLGAAGMLSLAGLPLRARANPHYPSRALNFICPWPAGGASDLTMRSLLAIAERELKQDIILENRAGGSGMIGVRAIADAPPDGYTIGLIPATAARFAHMGVLAINPLTDLEYICRTTGLTWGIAVRPDSPIKSIGELVASAKARPGHLTYAHSGLASSSHVAMEMFIAEAGIDLKDLPQKGGAPALQALRAGKADVLVDSTSWAAQVREGKLRLLAILTEKRIPLFPNTPTLKELGYPVVMTAPNGIGAPKGLDPAHKLRLREVFRKAVLSDEFRTECEAVGAPIMYLDADEYREFAVQTYAEEAKLVERMKLKALLAEQTAQ